MLITGASSGIGLALCRQLVANGATVFPTGKRQITDLAGYMPADLSQQAGRDLLTGHLEQETDHIDVAIYNAGILGSPQVALRDYEERTWRSVLELNVTAIQLLHQRRIQDARCPEMDGPLQDDRERDHRAQHQRDHHRTAGGEQFEHVHDPRF